MLILTVTKIFPTANLRFKNSKKAVTDGNLRKKTINNTLIRLSSENVNTTASLKIKNIRFELNDVNTSIHVKFVVFTRQCAS